jgi:hypothetical protein
MIETAYIETFDVANLSHYPGKVRDFPYSYFYSAIHLAPLMYLFSYVCKSTTFCA